MSSWANRSVHRKRDLSFIPPVIPEKPKPVSDIKPKNEIIYPSPPLPVVTVKHRASSHSGFYQKDTAYLDTYESTLQRIQAFIEQPSDAVITFIIPTIDRPSLTRTLTSIFKQTNTRWRAIVIFDGCEPTDQSLLSQLQDERILYISINKIGRAGNVRNIGMSLVTSPWIGFVDDDDVILPTYIEHLLEESERLVHADLISFRMIDSGQVIPPPFCQSILPNQIGISFAMKMHLVNEGFLFTEPIREDYHLVIDIKRAKKVIILSEHVAYLTRNSTFDKHPKITRIVLH
jgi:hypothetical protein